VWNEELHQCSYLQHAKVGYKCAIYQDIINKPQREWYCAPAFGAGCCSSLNSDRQELLKKMRGNTDEKVS